MENYHLEHGDIPPSHLPYPASPQSLIFVLLDKLREALWLQSLFLDCSSSSNVIPCHTSPSCRQAAPAGERDSTGFPGNHKAGQNGRWSRGTLSGGPGHGLRQPAWGKTRFSETWTGLCYRKLLNVCFSKSFHQRTWNRIKPLSVFNLVLLLALQCLYQ